MSKNFLEINNVSFKAGGKTKVKNVSFNIENKGDIIYITIYYFSFLHILNSFKLQNYLSI